jgi:prevent-host-death family protein
MTKTVGATDFKQNCLSLLETVGPEGIVITKHGRPVAKLVPIGQDSSALIGALRGQLQILGDIESTGIEWDAQS